MELAEYFLESLIEVLEENGCDGADYEREFFNLNTDINTNRFIDEQAAIVQFTRVKNMILGD